MKTHTLSNALVALELESACKALGWDEEEEKKKKKSWQIKSVKSLSSSLKSAYLQTDCTHHSTRTSWAQIDGWTNAHTHATEIDSTIRSGQERNSIPPTSLSSPHF